MLTRREFVALAAAPALSSTQNPLLSDGQLQVSLTAERSAVAIESLRIGGIRENLVFANPDTGFLRGGTALLPERGEWQFSRLSESGRVIHDASRIRVEGVVLGPETAPYARENWELTLDAGTLHWQVDREFLRGVRVTADRLPAIVIRTVVSEGGQ